MKTLISWKNDEGTEVANYHKKSNIIYVSKEGTSEDINNFKTWLEEHDYNVIKVFQP